MLKVKQRNTLNSYSNWKIGILFHLKKNYHADRNILILTFTQSLVQSLIPDKTCELDLLLELSVVEKLKFIMSLIIKENV